jgi:hypothetical protein
MTTAFVTGLVAWPDMVEIVEVFPVPEEFPHYHRDFLPRKENDP